MARAWRAHRAMLRARFKDIVGSKDPTKAKASPPYNISKEDWEYLCDMCYMAREWRAHRAMLRAHFKDIGGSKDPTKAKASPPYNISKED
ncbi:hypothetical protein R6Q57_009094 [Mikania cordata]